MIQNVSAQQFCVGKPLLTPPTGKGFVARVRVHVLVERSNPLKSQATYVTRVHQIVNASIARNTSHTRFCMIFEIIPGLKLGLAIETLSFGWLLMFLLMPVKGFACGEGFVAYGTFVWFFTLEM
jgi:hypothetical protein